MKDTSHLFFAKRENNPKRDFIILNTRQAKHFPSAPDSALELMETLGQRLAGNGRAEKPTVVIGFAETAVAIGAVAAGFFRDCFYVTTTRENLPDWANSVCFEECHSHASHHTLCVLDEEIFRRAEQIILVDDEFTTGSTAINLIKALGGCLARGCRVYAGAFAASEESIENLRGAGIEPIILSRLEDIANSPRISPRTARLSRATLARFCGAIRCSTQDLAFGRTVILKNAADFVKKSPMNLPPTFPKP